MGLFDLTPDQNDQLLGMAMGLLSQSGPSTAPRPLGAAFGAGIQGMQQAKQAGQARQMTQLQAQLLGLQGKQMQTAIDRENAWNAMFGVPPNGVTTPPAPTVQAQQSPDVPPGVAPAVNPGTPSQVAFTAGRMGVAPPSTQAPGANLPDDVRRMIGMLGPEKGGAMLAQYQIKNTERGQYVPETITVNGTPIPGQRDRLSGKFEPYNPNIQGAWAPEDRKMPGPNGQMVNMPGQKNNLTGEWKPLDPSLTRLNVTTNIAPEQAGATQAAKDLAEVGKNYYEASQQARKDLGKLQMSRRILENGVETGMGTETKMGIANFAKSMLGVELDPKLPDKEMLQGLGQAMAIDSAPKGQGQVSNYEREIFQKAVATNMGRSTEGNKKLMDYYIRLKQRDAQVGQMYEQELEKNGRITPQFLAKVREHYEKPTFSEDEMKGLVGMAGGQQQPNSRPPLSSFQR